MNPGQPRLELFAPTFAFLSSSTQSRLGADHGPTPMNAARRTDRLRMGASLVPPL